MSQEQCWVRQVHERRQVKVALLVSYHIRGVWFSQVICLQFVQTFCPNKTLKRQRLLFYWCFNFNSVFVLVVYVYVHRRTFAHSWCFLSCESYEMDFDFYTKQIDYIDHIVKKKPLNKFLIKPQQSWHVDQNKLSFHKYARLESKTFELF